MSAHLQTMPAGTLRRGWCPSTLKPMETGDGWIVRLHPPGASVSPEQLIRIAELAEAHGNGLIEISARGNMQLRGVTPGTHPALVEALLDEQLVDEHDSDGPQRLTLVSPLTSPCPARGEVGESRIGDVFDVAALAAAIEARGRAIAGLPAKCLIVVDGGGLMSLDGLPADLRICGVAHETVVIGLPDGNWRGPLATAHVVDEVSAILQRFAALRRTSPDMLRMRDCGPAVLAALSDLPAAAAPKTRPAPHRTGLFALDRTRFAAIAGMPFGRCEAHVLAELARSALSFGVSQCRLSPWRGLACLDLAKDQALSWLATADAHGLIVTDDDPRLSVQACAGKPACLRAQARTMADAQTLAIQAAPLLASGVSVHVSGCVKSCAHPGASDLTLVGLDEGRYAVVLAGGTRKSPIAALGLDAILARLQPGRDLHLRLSNAQTGPGAGTQV